MKRKLILLINKFLLFALVKLFDCYQKHVLIGRNFMDPKSLWIGTLQNEDLIIKQCKTILEYRLKAAQKR